LFDFDLVCVMEQKENDVVVEDVKDGDEDDDDVDDDDDEIADGIFTLLLDLIVFVWWFRDVSGIMLWICD